MVIYCITIYNTMSKFSNYSYIYIYTLYMTFEIIFLLDLPEALPSAIFDVQFI